MTGGVHLPFSSGYKTARLVEAAAWARGSKDARMMFDEAASSPCIVEDVEMEAVYESLREERNDEWD